MRLASALILSTFCFSVSAFAQQSSSPAQAPAQRLLSTSPSADVIILDVVVIDKSGNSVPGLQQQDFTILDDKVPRPFADFHATKENDSDFPLQAVFVVDAVNTSVQSVGYERQQMDKFLRRDNGRLPVPTSLVFLTDTSSQIQPVPTRDGNSLAGVLDSTQTGLRSLTRSSGFYGASERLQLSLRALQQLTAYEATQPGRKLVIWFSPGWPLLSGPRIELSKRDQEGLFNNVVALSRAMRQARITLFSVDPLGVADAGSFRTFDYKMYLKGVPSSNKVEAGNLALQVLAEQSGGRVLNSSNDITDAISSCLVDAKAFYTLSFDSPPADHPNEYHSLEVKVDKPGLTARTRTGYYAQLKQPD